MEDLRTVQIFNPSRDMWFHYRNKEDQHSFENILIGHIVRLVESDGELAHDGDCFVASSEVRFNDDGKRMFEVLDCDGLKEVLANKVVWEVD